jgi:hypothetical protein
VAKGVKPNWYCPPKEKQLGKNQNGGVGIDIEIKELNRYQLNYQKNMF